MTRVFKPQDFSEQTAFVKSHCRICKLQLGCTLLAEARPLDAVDPDYPSELVYDDDGRPDCTDFQGPDAGSAHDAPDDLPPVTARPLPPPPAPEPQLDIVSIETTIVARGVVDAVKLRPGRRSWTVPYATVREIFAEEGEQLRDALGVPTPTRARVHANRLGVVITARSKRDGKSVSSSVRLKLAGARR